MAKKYYWLKLKEDFFRQKEIKKLRKIAGGDTYVIIYLKLQLLSIRNEGKIYFEQVEDDFAEELSLDLDEDVENVRVTLLFLEKHRLIEFTEIANEYILPEVLPCIGKESDSAARVRKHRDKQKMLQSNVLVTSCNAETETEIETEIETKQDDLEQKDVVDIFAHYDIDINPVLEKYPELFSSMKKEEINMIAMILSSKKKEGRITNPVGLMLTNPEKTIISILEGTFYSSVKKKSLNTAKYTSEYEIYVPPSHS